MGSRQRYPLRVFRVLALCALTAMLSWACAPAQRQASSEGPGEPAAVPGGWPFTPAEVRLHPLSRLVRVADGLRLEALVECQDRDGDPIRTVGMLWVQAATGDDLRAVEADLSSMDTNNAIWDEVLRVYRLRVELPATACGEGRRLPVEIRLRMPADRVIQAKADVVCP